MLGYAIPGPFVDVPTWVDKTYYALQATAQHLTPMAKVAFVAYQVAYLALTGQPGPFPMIQTTFSF